ncbi:thiamine-phosphate kinase [Nocardia spumae]|uniref:thiamine-phosphate kinase n=1 Tax=Nocardia spumae TaxID=2887190 RepID=UPI001D14F15D|nr:thiamine-phosphate kinase [Nocardia spumae]
MEKESEITDSTPRTVRELGEFALIARMNAGRTPGRAVLLGPGDDAAVLAAPAGRYVVSTDMLIQDRHFRLEWSAPRDIGAKAIAQNAADVVAMGATPTGFVVSLGCPGETPVDLVDGLVEGMWTEAQRAGASIAGGDVVRSPLLVLSVTAFGDPGAHPVLRSGAGVDDTVAVAGRLGWSAAGLAVLAAGADRERFADLVAAHRVPQPPYASVLELPATAAITAMTDVSDGLLADLGHIAESSGVAIDIDTGTVSEPALRSAADALGADPLTWVLAGGEDHAFAATFRAGAPLPPGWRRIGRVRSGAGVLVDGCAWHGPLGWESFGAGE